MRLRLDGVRRLGVLRLSAQRTYLQSFRDMEMHRLSRFCDEAACKFRMGLKGCAASNLECFPVGQSHLK